MAEGKVPRAALFLAPVQLSHGNFSWLVADILIFFSWLLDKIISLP